MRRALSTAVAALLLVLILAGRFGVPAAAAAPSSPAGSASAEAGTLVAQKEKAEVELLIIKRRLASVQRDIAQGQTDLKQIRSELASSEELLQHAKRDLDLRQEQLGARVRDIYKRGRIGRLELLVQSVTLTDFLDRAKLMSRVLLQERRLVESIRCARARAATLSASYQQEQKAKAARLSDLRDMEAALGQSQRRQAEIVAGLGDRLAAARQAMQGAEDKMSAINKASSPPSTQASGSSTSTSPPSTHAGSGSNSAGPRRGRNMRVKATAYCDGGYTASGLPCGPGIIATDPRVIALGTRVYVPGYGEAIAADTGGAVKGAFIDVWLPTFAQAYAWGVKYLTITILD